MGKHKKSHRTYPEGGKQKRKALKDCIEHKGFLYKLVKPKDGAEARSNYPDMIAPPMMSAHRLTDRQRLVTAESVRAGHPDKLCDRIADTILDAHLEQDKNARVAVEVMATDGKIVIAGEITSNAKVNYPRIVYDQMVKTGYDGSDISNGDTAALCIDMTLHDQSFDIAQAVDGRKLVDGNMAVRGSELVEGEKQTDTSLADTIGAGDQGIMVGYATAETPELMPLPVVLAHNICKKLDELMPAVSWLGADGKAQVTVLYNGDRPVAVTNVVVSFQHDGDGDHDEMYNYIMSEVLLEVIPTQYWMNNTKVQINPSGCFIKGGPAADTGLTGRKLAVDAYGPIAHIGGGAMSGKDPTKVDRSGAYAARWVAKNIVAAGLAKRCEVQIAYAIGKKKPVSVSIDTFGTAPVSDETIINAVKKTFDLRPGAIIEQLKLRDVCYAPLAAYGHFGRTDLNMPWESADKVDELLSMIVKTADEHAEQYDNLPPRRRKVERNA